MKGITIFCFLLLSVKAFAQTKTTRSVYTDGYGWKSNGQHDSGGPKTTDGLNSIARQMDICRAIESWIKASYIPKKYIGTTAIYNKPGIENMDGKLVPIRSYGAVTHTWSVEIRNAKPVRIPETGAPWNIIVNDNFGESLGKINVNTDYYFFLPDDDFFKENTPKETRDQYDIKTLPQFKNYYPSYNSFTNRSQYEGTLSSLLLCKDNHLPIVKVTNAELFQKIKQMIDRGYQEKLKEILEKNKGEQEIIKTASGYQKKGYEKALSTFSMLTENYKGRMNEPAQVPGDFDYMDFVNGMDIFTRMQINEGTPYLKTYTVYKYEPRVYEQAKQGIPLWIRVLWQWLPDDEKTLSMHKSIINNFDFQYLYDFVFNPNKLNGRAYKPLRSPDYKETTVVAEKSVAAKLAEKNSNIFFFEDFSSNAIGQKPTTWSSTPNINGNYIKVVTVEHEEGKWLEIVGNNDVIPASLAKPLPQNFDLSFDVGVPNEFPLGANRLDILLANKKGVTENSVRVSIHPGLDNRDGEIQVEPNFGKYNGDKTKWYTAPGFTNNKAFNRVKVSIQKNEGGLQVFVNSTKVADYDKAMPANSVFNTLQFSQLNSYGETEKYFISNIKITKR